MRAIAMTWYEAVIRFDNVTDDGKLKYFTETHVLRSISFTTAEEDAWKLGTELCHTESEVKNITPRDYVVLCHDDGADEQSAWYKAKIRFIHEDDKGKLTASTQTWLVESTSVANAVEAIQAHFRTKTMVDYTIASVAETKIVSVQTD